MTDASRLSVRWLQKLAAGDDRVVAEFLEAYGPPLERIAGDRMSPALARRVGTDDVLQSVCRTFFRRAQSGEFTLPDRDSLWRLLCAITLNKVRRQARVHGAVRRGGLRDTVGEAGDRAAGQAPSREVPPDQALVFADQLAFLIESLGETEGRLLQLKMDGHSHAEIAERLNCTERTVGRLLVRCQQRLKELLPSEDRASDG